MTRSFTCAKCHKHLEIDADWTTEMAVAEYQAEYPNDGGALLVRVCDDCFEEFNNWRAAQLNPNQPGE